MKLIHVYHLYVNGNFEKSLTEHINCLKSSDLINNLDNFYLGIVGDELNSQKAINYLNSLQVYPDTITTAAFGYEQETLKNLRKYALTSSAYLFYAHSKGSAYYVPTLTDIWKFNMEYFNIMKWQVQIQNLEKGYDTAGCFWHKGDSHAPPHYVGNYWWAKNSYINSLPDIENKNRWEAEFWIGKNPSIKAFDAIGNDYNIYVYNKYWE